MAKKEWLSKALERLAKDGILPDGQIQAMAEKEREVEKRIEGEVREGDEAKGSRTGVKIAGDSRILQALHHCYSPPVAEEVFGSCLLV
jgi:hypothetical protein